MPQRRSPEGSGKCPKIKKDGTQCKQGAGLGTDHLGWGYCKYHGGTSAAMNVHAQREMVRGRMSAFGTELEVEPGEALLGEVRRSAGIVNWLETVIAEYTQIDVEDIRAHAKEVMLTLSDRGRETAAWVELYREERKMLRAASSEALKNNIAERQVKVAEEQGRLIAHVLQAVFNDPELGLSAEQKQASRAVTQRHLRAVAG